MPTYYINATGGDDSRTAVQAQNVETPWLTIQKGLDNVTAGDTISVAAGTYGSTSSAVSLLTKAHGTAGNLITLQGAGKASVTVYGSIKLAHNYYKVNGFTFDVYPYTDTEVYAAVELNTSSYSEVSDCNITNSYTISDTRKIHGVSIYGTSTSSTIKNNKIDKHTYLTFSFWVDTVGIIIEGNEVIGRTNTDVHLQAYDCIYLFGDGHIIRNNTFRDYWGGDGTYSAPHTDWVQSFADSCDPDWDTCVSKNHILERNFVYNFTGESQLGHVTTDSSVNIHSWTFRNNIFYNIARNFYAYPSGFKWYNNTFYLCSTGQNTHPILFVYMPLSKSTGTITIDGPNKRITPTNGWNAHILTDDTKITLFNSVNNTASYYTKVSMDPGGYWDGDTGTWFGYVVVSEAMTDETISNGIAYEYRGSLGSEVKNNIFIGCGGSNDATLGWYDTEGPTTAQLTADYNYVAQKPTSSYASKSGFSEANGVNGGNPYLYNIASPTVAGSYALTANSTILIGEGVDLSSSFTNDYANNARGTGTWDIGAYDDGTPGAGGGGKDLNLRFTKPATR